MNKIGITTTVPIEILLAAGYQPVDLNNEFITDPSPERLVNIAEKAGFPLNCCSWIKGIYGVRMDYGIDDFMLTHHIKTRIEVFLDMLVRQKYGWQAII